MVNGVLQEYVRQARHKMLHMPLTAQRRIVHEVVARIQEDARSIRAAHTGMSLEDATKEAIDAFCPIGELLPVYGPDEGIIRRSTAEWVVRAPPRVQHGAIANAKRWGAAAAAVAIVGILVAVVAFLPGAPPPGDLAPESAGPLMALAFTDANGTLAETVTVGDAATMEVAVGADAGCLRATLTAPDGEVFEHSGCLVEPWVIDAPAAGNWTVRIDLDAFTGSLEIRAR